MWHGKPSKRGFRELRRQGLVKAVKRTIDDRMKWPVMCAAGTGDLPKKKSVSKKDNPSKTLLTLGTPSQYNKHGRRFVDPMCCWGAAGRDVFTSTAPLMLRTSPRAIHFGNTSSAHRWTLGCWTVRWFCQLARLLLLRRTVVSFFGEVGESGSRPRMHVQIHRFPCLPTPPPLRETNARVKNMFLTETQARGV